MAVLDFPKTNCENIRPTIFENLKLTMKFLVCSNLFEKAKKKYFL